MSREHPLSATLAVQTVKRYLSNPQEAIRLHDSVLLEAEKAFSACAPARFPFDTQFSPGEFARRAATYEALTEILQSIFATGCYWGADSHISLWVRAVQRIANPASPGGGPYYEIWQRFSYYPSLLLLYAGGIAAIAARKYDTFAALAWRPIIRRPLRGQQGPLAALVNAETLLETRDAQNFNPGQNLKTPTSGHLFIAMRPRLSELLPDDVDFQRAFDEFEYLICLSVMHHTREGERFPSWPPIGSFVWREPYNPNRVVDQLSREADSLGSNWPPLKAGLFDGSPEAFKAARDALHSSRIFRELAF